MKEKKKEKEEKKKEKEEKKRKPDDNESGPGGNYNRGGKSTVVTDHQIDPAMKVETGHDFYKLTNDYVPTRHIAEYRNVQICNKYHMLGHCHNKCPRVITHKVLPYSVKKYYLQQIHDMKDQAMKRQKEGKDGNEGQNKDLNKLNKHAGTNKK